MSIKTALKKLLVAWGGDASTIKGQSIESVVEAMAKMDPPSGGGSGSDSSGGDVLAIGIDSNTYALNKTWQEVADALAAGKVCVVKAEAQGVITWAGSPNGAYTIQGITVGGGDALIYTFTTNSADGYPALSEEPTVIGGGSGESDSTDSIFNVYISETDFENGTNTAYYTDAQLSTGMDSADLVAAIDADKRIVINPVDSQGVVHNAVFPVSVIYTGMSMNAINSHGDIVVIINYDID